MVSEESWPKGPIFQVEIKSIEREPTSTTQPKMMTGRNKRVAQIAILLLIVSLAMLVAPILKAEATVITGLRIGKNKGTVSVPESTNTPEDSTAIGLSRFIEAALIKACGWFSPNRGNADDLSPNRFQQQLFTALVVVTSIIFVLFFFLIWMGSGRKKAQAPSPIPDLPPAADRNIESIDAAIREHLKNINPD